MADFPLVVVSDVEDQRLFVPLFDHLLPLLGGDMFAPLGKIDRATDCDELLSILDRHFGAGVFG